MVLEGVGWDPVGAFEENWFPVDAEIKAQSWRPDNWLLDKFYCAKIHLQETFFLSNTETLMAKKPHFNFSLISEAHVTTLNKSR